MSLDYEKILYSNPSKKLRIQHEELKKNFSEASAKEYSELYKGQPLSFLLENSRYIFSEPTYGYQYYMDQVTGKEHILECVHAYPEEYEKLHDYVETYRNEMEPDQLEMFESLESKLKDLSEGTNHLRMLLEYSTNRFGNEEMDASITIHPMVYLSLAPFEMMQENADPEILERIYEIGSLLIRGSKNADNWKMVFEAMTASGLLMNDSVYVEAVNQMPRDFRTVIQHLSSSSLQEQIRSINEVQERPNDMFYREYVSPEDSVLSLFEMQRDQEEYANVFEKERSYYNDLTEYAYDLLSSIATFEYTTCENPDTPIKGFQGLFQETTTVAEAMSWLNGETSKYVTESELGEASPTVRKAAGSYGEEPTEKKVTPPSSNSAAQKIQYKYMDKEAKSYKRMAKAKEVGDEVKGAANAVAAIPKNIANSIDGTLHEWDELDDERRKSYMTKPGFRKKLFRNLKLGLLYATSAQVSLLMVPVTMLCRHYSKIKDRRIRNQLARELDTEIQICQEKINDANSESDRKEKYKLMRIKSELEAQRDRVKLNSRYI